MADDEPVPDESAEDAPATAHPDGIPYDTSAAKRAITDAVSPQTSVEEDDDDEFTVARSASFADVASRPSEQAIEEAEAINEVVFYRRLVRLDGDLAGTVRAKSQVGGMGVGVTHPAVRGHEEELSSTEKEIMESCKQLLDTLGIPRTVQTFFRRLIIHGNDANHIEYEEGNGVTALNALPLQALTITDDKPESNSSVPAGTEAVDTTVLGTTDMDETIHEGNYYVLNEGDGDDQQVYPERDILHFAINRRANWYKDRHRRDTFGVWGERRLQPLKFAMQAKANTLSNKVAMDDSLLAREVYQIDVEKLFGHIPNDKERTQKAKEYKNELKKKLNNLAPDEKPIIPEEVSVNVEGPDGSTAENQVEFIEMMNNTMQHALTFHSASFGRDAGGSLAGNKPAKEMSDTGIKSLRGVVKREFRELFRIHTLLAHEDAREPATNPDGSRKTDVEGYEQWQLKDDITLPELTFDPVSRRDKSDRVKDAVAAYEKGVADLNEARSWVELDPISEDEVDDMLFRRDPTQMEQPGEGDGEGGVGREQNESEPDQNQGPGQGDNPNDDGTGEASERAAMDVDEYVYDEDDEGGR